jgi:RNA recognition motif-containing protein
VQLGAGKGVFLWVPPAISSAVEASVNIYVGNLSFDATEQDLRKAFEAHGTVSSSSVVMDRMTGKSRGFGFVVMEDQAQALAAINGLNGQDLLGRRLRINEAKPRA